jgi:hypothetical protein
MGTQQLSTHLCECRENCGNYTPFATKTDKRRDQIKGQPMRLLPGHNKASGGASDPSNVGLMAAPGELDELKIRGLRSMSDADAARVLDERLRFLERQYKRNFVERGFILVEVEERQLWKELVDADTNEKYTSFDRWVCGAASHSRADCFEAMRAVKELRDVPREQLMGIPRKNIGILSQLSTKVRKDPDIIAAAQDSSKKEFIAHIQGNYPDQHVEQESKVTTYPTVSQREIIDSALEIAAWVYGSAGRESAMEAVSNFFLEGDCEKEGFGQWSNKRAFETAKARGEIV